MKRAGLTESLRALEVIRDGNAVVLRQAGMHSTAFAANALTDNVIHITLELAAALQAALAGDLGPAKQAAEALALDRVEVQP
jgi:hypothetical protein